MSASPIVPRPVVRRHSISAGAPASTSAGAADVALQRNSGRLSPDSIAHRSASATLRDVTLLRALLAQVPPPDRTAAATAIPAILSAARKSGTTDPNQVGYLLATAQTESDFGANMIETGHSKAWFERNYGSQDGNRPGTSDGYIFRGRGYVQTTFAGRYAELSRRLGLPDVPARANGKPIVDALGKSKMVPALVADPDRMTEPSIAAQVLVVGVKNNLFTHNARAALEKTIPAGKEPGAVDFYHARAIVNGIVKAQALAITSEATRYARILTADREPPMLGSIK